MAEQRAGLPGGEDWTTAVADRIEAAVTTVRDKTTVPVTKVARIVVFGAVVATMGAVALAFLTVLVLRLHVYIWFGAEGRKVWVAYAALGAIFLFVGGFCWRKRTPRSAR
ncbi:MAG: hypothetical protein ACR2KC_04325 [Acidimicrobiales bacterium]